MEASHESVWLMWRQTVERLSPVVVVLPNRVYYHVPPPPPPPNPLIMSEQMFFPCYCPQSHGEDATRWAFFEKRAGALHTNRASTVLGSPFPHYSKSCIPQARCEWLLCVPVPCLRSLPRDEMCAAVSVRTPLTGLLGRARAAPPRSSPRDTGWICST